MPKKMTKITTSELILSAIFYLQQKNGVTAKEITKYICEKRGCAQKHMKENVKKALERATVKGIFCRSRGLYRINNGFGLNKILNKTKGKGRKANKVTKPKENVTEGKANLQVSFDDGNRSEQTPLSEMVDERMNDENNENGGVYAEVPATRDQDDDDDEDFEDTDDDDENDFFSDDMNETERKSEAKTLFFNENVDDNSHQEMDDFRESSDCNSFTDPFRKVSSEEYLENEPLEEGQSDKEDEGKESVREGTGNSESEIVEVESEEIRENSKEPSGNPSETVQCNDENQSGDEYRNNEDYFDQQPEEMDWDCQLNDLECIDRLLDRDDHPMDMAQRKHVGGDMAWDDTEGMMIQKNNSRIEVSVKDDPTDSFEASQMNDSTR